MIIQCDKCSTKFRLDDSSIGENGVRIRCTKCQNVFLVPPPASAESSPVDLSFDETPAGKPEPKKPPGLEKAKDPVKPRFDNLTLKFDFEKGEEKAPPAKPPAAGQGSGKDNFSFEDIDYSFAEDRSNDKKEEDDKKGFLDFNDSDRGEEVLRNISSGSLKKEGYKAPADKEDRDDFDFTGIHDDGPVPVSSDMLKKDGGAEEEEKPARSISSAIPGIAESPEIAPSIAGKEKEDSENTESFSDILSHSLKEGPPEEFEEAAEDTVNMKKDRGKSPSRLGLIIALFVFLIGGGAIYFSGVINTLALKLTPQTKPVVRTVSIESINGFFAENKNFGRLFVIEAKIRNASGVPQSIKRVTGNVFNERGDKIASQSASPGRVVSNDDIKNLPKELLLKPFKDASGGLIPPRGTIPVMVIFTDLPVNVAEYGLDIVR